jgi:hypothetical protein
MANHNATSPGIRAGWAARLAAARAGRRAARHGSLGGPGGQDRGAGRSGTRPGLPAYPEQLRTLVNRAGGLRRAAMLSRHRLANEIIQAAGTVVAEKAAGTCTEAHKTRFRRSLSRWEMGVKAHGAWAQATADEANVLLSCYWNAACEWLDKHDTALGPASEPERITLNPRWPSPLELLKHWTITRDAADAGEYGVLVRALEIVNFAPDEEP